MCCSHSAPAHEESVLYASLPMQLPVVPVDPAGSSDSNACAASCREGHVGGFWDMLSMSIFLQENGTFLFKLWNILL